MFGPGRRARGAPGPVEQLPRREQEEFAVRAVTAAWQSAFRFFRSQFRTFTLSGIWSRSRTAALDRSRRNFSSVLNSDC